MTEEQLKAIASQLSCPKGEDGMLTADLMHRNNIGMTRNTIKSLGLVPQDKVLELGHGNGHHIAEIVAPDETISYHGLEISELMYNEASQFNKSQQSSFRLYSGEHIPFENTYFTKVMTVNTLYFWKNPPSTLNEIYRVLKPGGKFYCTFASQNFMEKLPFTNFIFELYDYSKWKKLVQLSPFQEIEWKEHTEQIRGDGQVIERNYVIAILEK